VSELLFLAVEEAIPADHPASLLAVPIGLLFLSGAVVVLLWSNYGFKKAAGIYGIAFFGFSFLLGVFWWFGGPGIPAGLGISHLPGQAGDHYVERWYAFEAGSERAGFFTVDGSGEFVTAQDYLGLGDAADEDVSSNPAFTALSGSLSQAVDGMQEQFLPVDENGVARIGVERRQGFEEDAEAGRPDGAEGRANPFYSVEQVGEPRITDDPSGVRIATMTFQAVATFVDAEGIPVGDPVPVGDEVAWYAFFDPGATWFPSMLWTLISLLLFLLSLGWLDRLEQLDKAGATVQVEEPEDLAVPIAQ
jgi:hypothetical protein